MKIYISGKVTGDHNYRKKFQDAEDKLKAAGFEPINPVAGEEDGNTWIYYMKKDIKKLMDAEAIFMLDDWSDSPGATLEWQIANALHYPVYWDNGCTIARSDQE